MSPWQWSICLKLLSNKSSFLVCKEQWTPVWHELFMRDHIVSFLSGVLGLDGEKCTVPTKQCSPDWRRPPNPCCHGLESKRVPLSTHFTTLWVGDRPAPFLACFSLPLLRTMSLLVDWHTYVLLPIDLFFQEKHYKTIFLINIKTSVPSTGVCPLRSAHTSRHCLCVQRNHLWYLVPNWQCESDACPNQCCFNCPLTKGYPDIICFDGWFECNIAFRSWGKH